MEEEGKEKRHYTGKPKSDIINFPVLLRRDLLSSKANKEVLKLPVHSTRIIFKILNDVSHDQFRSSNIKQQKQTSLFEDEFKTEHNTYARFTFNTKDISSGNDYGNIKKGLEFLENFQKGWFNSVNEKGKNIKSYGGFISNSNISEGKISFLMSSYWLEKVVLLEKYNAAYTEIAWTFSKSKQILFYLWLLEVPDSGTRVNFNSLQEAYDYNYTNAGTYAKNVLKAIKTKLDRKGNKSFNYSVKGEMISIVPYYTKDTDVVLKKATSKKQEVTQKLNYWKQRHGLSDNNVSVLKTLINIEFGNFKLFKASYDRIVISYREEKKKVTELQGDEFIRLFQEEIKEVYKSSAWGGISPKGYPIIE